MMAIDINGSCDEDPALTRSKSTNKMNQGRKRTIEEFFKYDATGAESERRRNQSTSETSEEQ